MNRQLAYCTNVHAGADLASVRANLETHCLGVKQRFSPHQPMGVGMWVAAPAAKELLDPAQQDAWRNWLAAQGLVPFTFNGFPYGNFHEPVVKHRVYHPTWCDAERLEYTLDLIQILDALLPESLPGSISTLPLAWGTPELTDQQYRAAASQLVQVAETLARLEQETGRLITVCLEPEPGCAIQRADDVVKFFCDYLCGDQDTQWRTRYLRVCHDICHSAVMFEDQRDVLARYTQQGIQLGKIQVSSAVELNLAGLDAGQVAQRLGELSAFAEDRYLHQTTIRPAGDAPVQFFEDLAPALAAAERQDQLRQGQWRVHFHVPIYLESFGGIGTSQRDILCCLDALPVRRQFGTGGASGTQAQDELPHMEVETYAWGVLPASLQRPQLADGIADELQWLSAALD